MHFIQQAQLGDTHTHTHTHWWSLLMSSYSTRHNQTASSSSHCYFTFLDAAQSCTVIKIWFCAASLGKQVWFQEERKQPHSIWHTRVITGGRVLGHLYLVWGGVGVCVGGGFRGAARPSGLDPVPLEGAFTGLCESSPHHYWLQKESLHPAGRTFIFLQFTAERRRIHWQCRITYFGFQDHVVLDKSLELRDLAIREPLMETHNLFSCLPHPLPSIITSAEEGAASTMTRSETEGCY